MRKANARKKARRCVLNHKKREANKKKKNNKKPRKN